MDETLNLVSYILTEEHSGYEVFLAADPLGESEDYERFMLVALNDNKIVWREGLKKDRTHMNNEYRSIIDAVLPFYK